MYNLLKLIIFALNLAMAIAINAPFLAQRNFMDFMVESRDISQRNPQRSLECFSYYTPILNDITAEYQSSYAGCLKDADDARLTADSKTQGDRNNIENSAKSSCLALQECTSHENSIPYFTCYSDVGANNSKSMYVISTDASSALARVLEQYRLIQNDQYRCTNNSERAYVENTATTYDDLHNCIVWGFIPRPDEPEESNSTSTSTSTSRRPTSTPEPTWLPPTTTEEQTTSTTVSDTTLSSEEPAQLEIKDSKWARILAKIERNFH